jgi:glycosyltransferase involved in cell wall biosynthesis
MLSVDLAPSVPYKDPWGLGLPERMKMLVRGKRRVAYFYETHNNSTFRYRVYNMAQVLNESGDEISASYFFLSDLHRRDEIADRADVLVICRSRLDSQVDGLIAAFRRRRKKVLFDVDDLVFNTDYAHLIVHSLDQDIFSPYVWEYWFAYLSQLGATLKLCDGAITTNDYLAERIRDFVQIPVSIIPNFMNREQLDLSERVYAIKKKLKIGAEGLIHLGYFSGSPSHNRDFDIAAPTLEMLLEEDPRLGVVMVGYIKAGASLKRFGNRVKWFPFQDFINLQRLVGAVEFNLMPLQYNAFTNSKSELKYFEAAIVGTLSIASPTYTYQRAIRDGDNGYLAQAHQWASCIKRAVGDMEKNYQPMAERAYEDAKAKYAWFNQRFRIIGALGLE